MSGINKNSHRKARKLKASINRVAATQNHAAARHERLMRILRRTVHQKSSKLPINKDHG